MKKILLIVMFTFASVLAQAKTFKAFVLNMVQDDEGVKVLTQDPQVESVKPVSVYLRNDHKQFDEIMEILKLSKSKKMALQFSTEVDGVQVITKVTAGE